MSASASSGSLQNPSLATGEGRAPTLEVLEELERRLGQLEASAKAGPTVVATAGEHAGLEDLREPTSDGDKLGTDAVERSGKLREAAAK